MSAAVSAGTSTRKPAAQRVLSALLKAATAKEAGELWSLSDRRVVVVRRVCDRVDGEAKP